MAWSEEENAAIVADYLAMLDAELSGVAYVKAKHNAALRKMTGRSRPSIEFKHRNISAILKALGHPWIEGYKPACNFQDSLVEAVLGAMESQPPALDHVAPAPGAEAAIVFGPPPTMRNTPPPDEAEQMEALARRFDVASRQEMNRRLGRAGEERILAHERSWLRRAGRDDLARAVRWVSDEDGDGAGYDISSFEISGAPRLIEVKTTNGWERTPFHISSNEIAVAEAREDEWCLVRLWSFAKGPRAFEIRPPLSRHVSLTATSFRAEFST